MNSTSDIFQSAGASFAGSQLRRRRTQALLTHERLATLTGIDANTIRDIETGHISRPSAEIIRFLLDTLDTVDQTVTAIPTGTTPHELPPRTSGFIGRTNEPATMDRTLESTKESRYLGETPSP
jgi:transcriptional regulator with XRE-family HTH domain